MRAKSFVFAACAAGAALCATPDRAAADAARAWAAAKDNLPSQTALVIGADLTAITKSQLFNQFLPLAMSQQADARKVFETIKSTCKIDPLAAIHGVVYATDADRKQGAIYLSLGAGLDQPKLTKCFEDVAKATGAKDTKLTIKKTGAITELGVDKDNKIYVSWIGTDVLVIPSDPKDKGILEKWIGQKGGLAKAPVAKIYGNANTKGAIWGASSISTELEPGMRMKSAHGALTVAGGNLTIDLRTTLDSAKSATDAAAKATKQVAEVVSGANLPQNAKTMLQQISIKATGPEVAVKVSVPESEVFNIISQLGL